MKKLMNLLFLSCLKASELIEKKIQFKLTPVEKIRLTVHKSMCQACTNYEKQSDLIEKAIQQEPNRPPQQSSTDLEALKKAIITRLK